MNTFYTHLMRNVTVRRNGNLVSEVDESDYFELAETCPGFSRTDFDLKFFHALLLLQNVDKPIPV